MSRQTRQTRQSERVAAAAIISDSSSSEDEEESTFGSMYDSDRDPEWNPSDDSEANSSDEDADLDHYNEIFINAIEDEVENMDNPEEVIQAEDPVWTSYSGRHKELIFDGPSGLQQNISQNSSPLDIYFKIIDDEIINLIVVETNRFGQGQTGFEPTNADEIKRFLFLALYMGLVKLGAIPDYWSTNFLYNLGLPRNVMSRNRFQTLLRYVHFADNTQIQSGDRLGKIKIMTEMIQRKYKAIYYPGEEIVIDESLIPWRGRLVMRQYIPNKAHRYGVKLFKLCSLEGYTWAFIIYSGKSGSSENSRGLATKICLELSIGLLDQGRTLYVDNYYTSYPLAKTMLDRKTHVVGTIRSNRRQMPMEVMTAKLKRGEIVSREDQHGIVVLNWMDTRNVRMLSTKHKPILLEKDTASNQTVGRPVDAQDEAIDSQLQEDLLDELVDDVQGQQQQPPVQHETVNAEPQEATLDDLGDVQEQQQQQPVQHETETVNAEPQEAALDDLGDVQEQTTQQTAQHKQKTYTGPHYKHVSRFFYMLQKRRCVQNVPTHQRISTDDQAEPIHQRVHTDDQAGPSHQQVPTDDQAGPSHQRVHTDDQAGPSYQRVHTDDQAGPSHQRVHTDNQAGPSHQQVRTDDQAGSSHQRVPTDDQAGPSHQRVHTDDQAGPSHQRVHTDDQAGPSHQRVHTDDQAGPSHQRVSTDDQDEPSHQQVRTDDQAEPSHQRVHTDDQAGPSHLRTRRLQKKPWAVLDYNRGKGGIDLSDQMTSYASTIRKGVKWYRRVAFEILLGMSVVNSWIIYRKVTNKKIQMKKFREMLVSELLSQCRHERRPSSAASNRQHYLTYRINAQEKKVRRPCSGCYEKLRNQNVERKEAKKKPNFVVTYCDDCPKKPQLCLECFNRKH